MKKQQRKRVKKVKAWAVISARHVIPICKIDCAKKSLKEKNCTIFLQPWSIFKDEYDALQAKIHGSPDLDTEVVPITIEFTLPNHKQL